MKLLFFLQVHFKVTKKIVLMRSILFYILITLSILGCKKTEPINTSSNDVSQVESIVIADVEVLKEDLVLNGNKGRWYYKEEPFNGYSLKYYSNGKIEEKWGFSNGKREGIARRWTKNGKLQVESYYKNNRLSGEYKSWWENDTLASLSYYKEGVLQGLEKKWYSNGQLAKLRTLVDGKENGFQKAWLANGTLYVNYEAKNGRIFGMKRANSCYRLEDEKIIRRKKK